MTQVLTRGPLAEAEAPFSTFCLQMLPAVPMTQDQFFDLCQQNSELRLEEQPRGS